MRTRRAVAAELTRFLGMNVSDTEKNMTRLRRERDRLADEKRLVIF